MADPKNPAGQAPAGKDEPSVDFELSDEQLEKVAAGMSGINALVAVTQAKAAAIDDDDDPRLP